MSNPRIYVEACPLIDLVKHRLEVQSGDDREQDAWFTDRLIQAAKQHKVELFTSTLTIAECTHVRDEKKTRRLSRSFSDYWHPAADAIHVSSALAMKCDEFITTDGKGLLKRVEALAKLNLRACRPAGTRLLPPEFLQDNLAL